MTTSVTEIVAVLLLAGLGTALGWTIGSYLADRDRRGDRLSLWDAVRFVWHFRWAHPAHAETVWHDYRADVTRCGCGRTWGGR